MKIIRYILFIIYLISFKSLFWAYIPVETVFSDIKSNYKYYNELQELYNRQVIYPDSDWKLNPYDLLTRDEFVGITMEASCKKCTKPNTTLEILKKYEDKKPFYDVLSSNSYLYCISLAQDNKFIDSYSVWYKCEDMTYNQDKVPFCPNNYISLEEAISVILKNTNIFSSIDNDKVIKDINDWIIKNDLSTDVLAKNIDWSANQYYWYIKKALEYSIEEYNNLWIKKTYKLLELKDWKIYPKKLINKEEFLYMAYISIKTNSCKLITSSNLALKIEIVDSDCESNNSDCNLAKILPENNLYDFKAISSWVCDLWIDTENWYMWKFYNKTTWEEVILYGDYINDYTFKNDWIRQITLVLIDKCSNSWEVYNTLSISKWGPNKSLNVSIEVNSITWYKPFPISFYSIVWWWNWDYTYVWSFWNNEKSNWKNTEYIYNELGVYNILLTVTDTDWNIWTATSLIKVSNSWNCETQDSDNDWVNDCDDLCQLVYWKSINKWCPIITPCDKNCKCKIWKKCNVNTESVCSIKWICLDDENYNLNEINNKTNDCLEKYSSNNIYWNVICNTCPCLNYIDFDSTIRVCDYIFPAITSTWNTDIYSAWDSFEVQ